MASFTFFYQRITDWLDQNHSLIFLRDLCLPSIQSPEANPSSKLLWKCYLIEILSGAYSRLLKTDQSIQEDLLLKLLNFSHYGLERKASHLIEHSFLRFLPKNDQKRLLEKIVIFLNQLDSWVDGFWHQQILKDRFLILQQLVSDFQFTSKWRAASFLSECGYNFPKSEAA